MTESPKQAFLTELEKSHGSGLRHYLASRMTYAAADVPDLVQEVFLRMLRLDNHEAIRNPQAYLYTVASHVLHQHALRRRYVGARNTTFPAVATPLATTGSPPTVRST